MSERISGTNQNVYAYSSTVGTDMPIYYPWKGKSLNQIVSAIQKNVSKINDPSLNVSVNMFHAQPLKIYRKEIASTPMKNPSLPRTGVSIDELNRPGGTITIQQYKTSLPTGLDRIVLDPFEAGATSNSTDHPGKCASFTSNGLCLAQETNARRRCRSSGIMKHNYNSSAAQYLTTRNKTFQQNQFNFFVSGNQSATAGTALARNNVYASQGTTFAQMVYDASGTLSTCSKMKRPYTNVVYKPNNSKFAQQGGVSAGALINRKKFDTITNNVALYRKVYGDSVASAMGSYTSNSVFSYKGKINYPVKCTPTFPKHVNPKFATMIKCTDCKIV
jgi:hypothetical protein